MNWFTLTTKVVFFLCLSSAAFATPIFEGYYRLSLDKVHVGYFIQRYDLNSDKKTFSSTHYIYMNINKTVSIESMHAESDLNLRPRSYKYTSVSGEKSKTIDAIVKGKTLAIKTVRQGKASAREFPINDKVFFSSFLSHMILKHKKGFEIGNKFEYSALAEEDGKVYQGVAWVKEKVKEKGLDCYRVLNTFNKDKFVNWVDIKGESIKTLVPLQKLEAELMAQAPEAHKGFPFDKKIIQSVFGRIPTGKQNMLSQKK